jgi:hypothetical protein
MSDDLVLVGSYNSETAAEMAKGLLESVEIEAMVVSDDAGGMYPQFQGMSKGVRLYVRPDQAAEAREVLADAAEAGVNFAGEDDPDDEADEDD